MTNECIYDENGNIIYAKSSDGKETWWERNTKGNVIHYKNSDGLEYWYDRDENGNLIHTKDSYGTDCWYQYGVMIYIRYSNGETAVM